jgi:hypothetical protein
VDCVARRVAERVTYVHPFSCDAMFREGERMFLDPVLLRLIVTTPPKA